MTVPLRRITIKGNKCVYCGDDANSKEHFPPSSYSIGGLILPSCLECNIIASNKYPFDFDKRCKYVQDQIRVKYKKVLKLSDDHDLTDMDYSLVLRMAEWQKLRD